MITLKEHSNGSVTVIICTYNECENVQKCVKSVLQSDSRINEVLVIDDCSTDRTIERVKELHDERVTAHCKDHAVYTRGKNDSIYYGALLAKNENILVADCDTIAVSTTDAINKLLAGADLVGTVIEIIPNDTLLGKCEQLEYDTAIRVVRPWLYKNFSYINNVSGAGFAIRRKHILEHRIPANVKGEDMALTQIGLQNGWKIELSSSVIKTYATPGIKALFIQRNRWVNGYYSVMGWTGRYVPLVESVTTYYRTLACLSFCFVGAVTSHFVLFTLAVLLLYFLNEYRFAKSLKMTLCMMFYRQINFVSALTFWKYGRTWKVIR